MDERTPTVSNDDRSLIRRGPAAIQMEDMLNARPAHRKGADAGFTLVEVMIVIAIILTLAAIASVHYERSIAYSKEMALRNDLSVMRQAIEQYTLDNQEAPQSLDELVSGGYLGEIPLDPVTGAKDWNTDASDVLTSDQASGGISNVHSGSDKLSPFEDTPYSSW